MRPELKIYSRLDLKNWLITNSPPIGLDEHIIDPIRAYALINNPYIKDEDAVVAAIYDGDILAAYSASFPDMHCGKRIWWATTLWCNPQFRGQGYGLFIIGSLVEAHTPELTFDRWGAPETEEIFKHLGYETSCSTRYILCNKAINRSTIKGRLALISQFLLKVFHHKPFHPSINPCIINKSTFIDGEAYEFIRNHNRDNLFIREQKMLNWILRYPFMLGCSHKETVKKEFPFSSIVDNYSIYAMKVYFDSKLSGVYIVRQRCRELAIEALYYANEHKDIVYTSVATLFSSSNCNSFVTDERDLCEFMCSLFYFPKKIERNISFSIPKEANLPQEYHMQLIDGDNFA